MTSFRRIRLNIMYQVEYGSDSYYLLKTWKDLIEKNVFLDNEPVYNNRFKMKLNKRQLLDLILEISETLALGYHLKEMYLTFNKNATEENCEEWFNSILEAFKNQEYQSSMILFKHLKTGNQKFLIHSKDLLMSTN